MSFLYDLKQKFRRALPRSVRPKVEEAIYVFLYAFSPARRAHFFNSGFSPASSRFTGAHPFADEPLQATLVDYVLNAMPEGVEGPRTRILDIGCGLGGGLRLAAERYPEAEIVGIDASAPAVRISRRRLADLKAVRVIKGNGRALPFDGGAFDFIFSIGAASYIGMPPFLKEAARVLEPDGVLTFSVGYTTSNWERQVQAIHAFSNDAGLDVVKMENITAHVFAAIDEDAPRRQALIDRVPKPFRGYADDWADMPGTKRHQQYVDGFRLDYAVVCRKRPPADQ